MDNPSRKEKWSNNPRLFQNILISSNRKPGLIETSRDREFCNNIFQCFLNNNNIKHYSRNTYLGVFFAERFNRTITDLLLKKGKVTASMYYVQTQNI